MATQTRNSARPIRDLSRRRGLDPRCKIHLKKLVGQPLGLLTDREATAGKQRTVATC